MHHFTIFVSFPHSYMVECDAIDVSNICGCMHEHPHRCHFPTWNIEAFPPVALAIASYFHMKNVYHHQTPRLDRATIMQNHCAYSDRVADSIPPSLFVWVLLVHGSDATIHSCSVLKFIPSAKCQFLGSQFRIFPSFQQRTFFYFYFYFILFRDEVNMESP